MRAATAAAEEDPNVYKALIMSTTKSVGRKEISLAWNLYTFKMRGFIMQRAFFRLARFTSQQHLSLSHTALKNEAKNAKNDLFCEGKNHCDGKRAKELSKAKTELEN